MTDTPISSGLRGRLGSSGRSAGAMFPKMGGQAAKMWLELANTSKHGKHVDFTRFRQQTDVTRNKIRIYNF